MKNINTNQLVPYYLMSSFLYYSAHPQWVSPLSDVEYDNLCKRLSDEWDSIEHPHKTFNRFLNHYLLELDIILNKMIIHL